MDEPRYCACGCGEQTNALDLEVQKLYRSGLRMREVGDKLGIRREYVKTILRRDPPKFKRGHSGRVVHALASYRNCEVCGRLFYSYHGESVCRDRGRDGSCGLTVSTRERTELKDQYSQQRQALLERHAQERMAIQEERKSLLREYHTTGKDVTKALRKLDRKMARLQQQHEGERRNLTKNRVGHLESHWEGFKDRWVPVQAEKNEAIWKIDSEWDDNGGYIGELVG